MKSSFGSLLLFFLSILILFIVWIAFISFSYEQLNANKNGFGKNSCNNLLFINNQTNTIITNTDIIQTTKCIHFHYETNQYDIVIFVLWLIFGPIFGIILYLIIQCCYKIKGMFDDNNNDDIEEQIPSSKKLTTRRTCYSSYNNTRKYYPSMSSYASSP